MMGADVEGRPIPHPTPAYPANADTLEGVKVKKNPAATEQNPERPLALR